MLFYQLQVALQPGLETTWIHVGGGCTVFAWQSNTETPGGPNEEPMDILDSGSNDPNHPWWHLCLEYLDRSPG